MTVTTDGLRGEKYPWYPYWGYYDLGPIQIPPLPRTFGMTDRQTGTVWYLSYDAAQGRLALNDTTPQTFVQIYGPYDGPFLADTGYRLGTRNGRLLYDDNFQLLRDHGPPPWIFDATTNTIVYQLKASAPPTNVPGIGLVVSPVHLSYVGVSTG